jgi:hypothetical protein
MTVDNRVGNTRTPVGNPSSDAQGTVSGALTPQAVPVQPTLYGQLLPSRSLRALKAVLDRYREQVAA